MVEENQILASLNSFGSESRWFYDNYNKIKDKFRGKFVLVKDKHVVLDATTMEELVLEAEKKKIDVAVSFVEFIPISDIALII